LTAGASAISELFFMDTQTQTLLAAKNLHNNKNGRHTKMWIIDVEYMREWPSNE
jgi:hypothetical protein